MTTNVGQLMTIHIHESTAGAIVFDSVSVVDFTHLPGYAGVTTPFKIDYAGTSHDAYMVQVTTDYLNPFATTLTVAQLTAMAVAAIGSAELAGTLLTITPLVAGSGYFIAPAVILAGGGVGGAAHTTITGVDGHVATAVVDTGGAGYSGATLAAPPASVTAVLTPSLTNGVLSLVVANAGANGYYNAVPAVTVAAPPAKVDAVATATIAAGAVTGHSGLNDTLNGFYTSAPHITVDAPPASVTATATPPLNNGGGGVTLGALAGVVGGGYYSVAPVVTLGGGNGNATATAVVVAGAVTTVTVTGAGTGYVGLVTVSIAPPNITPVQAVLSSILTNGRVTNISRDNVGAGYLTAPALSFAAAPAAVAGAATAVLTAHRVSSVSGVAGSGYFAVPVVSVAAPDVAPVQATVTATFS